MHRKSVALSITAAIAAVASLAIASTTAWSELQRIGYRMTKADLDAEFARIDLIGTLATFRRKIDGSWNLADAAT